MVHKSNEIPPRKSSPNIIRPSTEVYALQFLFFKCHKLPALYPPLIHGNRQNIKTEERKKIYILTHHPIPICSINQDGLGSFIVNTKYGVWSSVSLGVSRASRNYIPCHASNELTENISVSEFNVLFRFWRKMMCGRCFEFFFLWILLFLCRVYSGCEIWWIFVFKSSYLKMKVFRMEKWEKNRILSCGIFIL